MLNAVKLYKIFMLQRVQYLKLFQSLLTLEVMLSRSCSSSFGETLRDLLLMDVQTVSPSKVGQHERSVDSFLLSMAMA